MLASSETPASLGSSKVPGLKTTLEIRIDQEDLKSPQEVPGNHSGAVSMERSGQKPE